MAGARIEYDESGTTTYYFLLSIFGLVLLPLTYYLFPRQKEADKKDTLACQCEGCAKKAKILAAKEPKSKLKSTTKIVGLVLGWILFAYLLYRVFTMERTITIYDPYEILEIDRGASTQEIKKQYRELSKIYHPDRPDTGDPVKFMKIAKAYEALTDEEARKNWEEYGNPDGPQAATFGIALPSWIVDKKNSGFVLALYVAVFMIALPVVIGTWWYRSVKYSSANILMSTQQLYFFLITRMSTTPVKRLISIMTCALEFSKEHSTGLKERSSDNIELPKLLNVLPYVTPRNKDRFFSSVHATKARILVHAHLTHLDLSDELMEDLYHILKISPLLINEILTIMQQAFYLSRYRNMRDIACPTVESFENAIKLSPMLVQSLWDNQSQFLQIPHLDQDNLRHFYTKRRKIQCMGDLAKMKDGDRRQLVRALTDEEYSDMLVFLAQYPHVEMTASATVEDDEDVYYITAGSLVTISVELKRVGLLEYYGQSPYKTCSSETVESNGDVLEASGHAVNNPDEQEGRQSPENTEQNESGKKGSQKELSRKKKKGGKPTKKNSKPQKKKKQENKNVREDSSSPTKEDKEEVDNEEEGLRQRHKKAGSEEVKEEEPVEDEEGGTSKHDDDDEWSKLQKDVKKDKTLEATKDESHPVHCPHFPLEKQECWWVYVTNKKTRQFVALPQRVTGLEDTIIVTLQCPTPPKPCFEQYTVILRSDSYVDFKEEFTLKFTVHEAKKEVVETQQWKELEEEEEEEEAFEETDEEMEESESEYSD